jgi:hypothetical protein
MLGLIDIYLSPFYFWCSFIDALSISEVKKPAVILYITEERRMKAKKKHLRREKLGY